MKIKRSIYLLMSLMMILTGCGKRSTNASPLKKVVLNDGGSFSNGIMTIIRHEKLMERYLPEGVEVEWTTIAAGTETRDGILAGKIDIGTTALPIYIMGEESGLPLRMFSTVGGTPIKLYSNDENIQELSNFSSKDRIAVVGLWSTLHIAFLAEAYEQGLDLSQYENIFTVMPHADGLAALSGGNEINGLLLSFPTTERADAIDTIHEVFDLSDICIRYGINTVSIMSEERYAEHPEIAEAFLKAQQDAIQLYQDDPDYVTAFLAENWGIDPKAIKDAWEKQPLSMEVQGYDRQARLLYEMGQLEQEPKPFQELPEYENLMELQGK